jgi:hypothetical protein
VVLPLHANPPPVPFLAGGDHPPSLPLSSLVRDPGLEGAKAQGAICTPPDSEEQCYFMWVMLLSCKIRRKPQENPKIAKLVLLETRFETLQLLLMRFSLKQNTFTSILNLRLKDN